MKINTNNYEAFFLDYLEGNLSSDDVQMLRMFLSLHPELAEELKNFDYFRLTPEPLPCNFKSSMMKNRNLSGESSIEEKYIAKLEGNLTAEEEKQFNAFLENHPVNAKEYNIYTKTKLIPDPSLIYPFKKQIKKKTPFRKLYPYIAAAASIFLFIVTYIYIENIKKPGITYRKNDPRTSRIEKTIDSLNKKPVLTNNTIIPETHSIQHTVETGKNNSSINNKKILQQVSSDLKKEIKISEENEDIFTAHSFQNRSVKNTRITINTGSLYPDRIETLAVVPEEKPFVTEQSVGFREWKPEDINFWYVAELTVKGINKLNRKNIVIQRDYDTSGNLKHLAFNSEYFSFSTPLKNK